MKPFKPTYLYVKTHLDTGLQYFGKTVKDSHTYLGSGTRWLKHLNRHGHNVKTEIIGYFEDFEQCKNAALEFSKKHNIVKSNKWANLMEETLDGGFIPASTRPAVRARASATAREKQSLKGWAPSIKSAKAKGTFFTLGMLGKKHSNEAKVKISKAVAGKSNGSYGRFKFFNPNNLTQYVKVFPENCPHGWISAKEKAKIVHEAKKKKMIEENRYTGKKWYNDGQKQYLMLPENASGLMEGRLKQKQRKLGT